MEGPHAALVVGATGAVGTPLTKALLAAGWRTYALSRRRPLLSDVSFAESLTHLDTDLYDAAAMRDLPRRCAGITHVFHCANDVSAQGRGTIMANLLRALEPQSRLQRVVLFQGMKYYGCHLGPFPTPALENDPRDSRGDYYYTEEDLVRHAAEAGGWSWAVLRPHSVCGYSSTAPLNLAVALAIYGSLVREESDTLPFPASRACFDSLFQVMDGDLLARAAMHVATSDACANQAFNINNGDIFRWKRIWGEIAEWFGLQAGGPQSMMLAEFLDERHRGWDALCARHALREFPYGRLPGWVRGDYTPPNSRFACEYDLIADTVWLRQTGFHEVDRSSHMFRRIFSSLREQRVIP